MWAHIMAGLMCDDLFLSRPLGFSASPVSSSELRRLWLFSFCAIPINSLYLFHYGHTQLLCSLLEAITLSMKSVE